jgi:hypothetical protein
MAPATLQPGKVVEAAFLVSVGATPQEARGNVLAARDLCSSADNSGDTDSGSPSQRSDSDKGGCGFNGFGRSPSWGLLLGGIAVLLRRSRIDAVL